ncbi:holo-ACP synthase [Anaerolentibacter hominis]|uniref:holo-ACP synthase n=1 Tax=Anaerolentibacter hominis TaxID=3079009 RepID=UPI0031B87082
MILGLGTDLIENGRIEKACEKERFLAKYYTEQEMVLLQYRRASAAGNFAVKEAAAKALGTGFRTFSPIHVEVLRDELGKPFVTFRGEAAKIAERMGVRKIHVSISDTALYAVAVVILED